MKSNLKKTIFYVLTTLLVSCSNDDDIGAKTSADLSISVASNTNFPVANTNFTFTIIATNNGPLDATEVVVENKILSGYTFVNAEPSLGTFDQETGIWTIGDFEDGATATLIINVKVNETGEYNNKAVISGEQTDIVPANNVITNVLTLKPLTNDLLFTYEISKDAKPEVTITGLSQLWRDLSLTSKYDLIIPESIEGHPVTKIGEYAFFQNESITSIVLPNSVKSIGSSAFGYCSDLKSINIPENVINIGSHSFSFCENLNTITIPNSKAKIGSAAFFYCSGLTNIILPADLDKIEYQLFYNCEKLVNIKIPNTVEFIGDAAFYGCTSFTSFAIPNNLNSIESGVFANCTSLANFTLESNSHFSVIDGVLYDKNISTLINYPNGKSGSFSIPHTVTKIGQSAFAFSGGLTSVTIPEGVVTIGPEAFVHCKITSFTIPSTVKTIGSYAFGLNAVLTSVIINSIDPPITSKPFNSSTKIKSIKVPAGSLDSYKAAEGWSTYKDIIEAQ